MNDKFNKQYYVGNNQDKDRLGIFFYYNIIKNNFIFNSYLDYGCGVGHLLKKVEKIKDLKELYGLEINKYAVCKVSKNTRKVKIINNLDELKQKIDLVSLIHVIEHINDVDLQIVLNKIKNHLKKDGKLLIATPAKNCLAHNIKKDKWIGFKDSTHINIKTYNEWLELFSSLNFKVLKSGNDGLWDFPYKNFMFSFKFIKIILIMFIQILSGKLILDYNEGETFIFVLKSND